MLSCPLHVEAPAGQLKHGCGMSNINTPNSRAYKPDAEAPQPKKHPHQPHS